VSKGAECFTNELSALGRGEPDCRFVASGAARRPLLLQPAAGQEQNGGRGRTRPATRPVVRETSSELMIDRSLASRAGRMQLTGPACLGKTPARSDCPVALVLANCGCGPPRRRDAGGALRDAEIIGRSRNPRRSESDTKDNAGCSLRLE
jgi:hypothetical protein